jgi:hypothetical protein
MCVRALSDSADLVENVDLRQHTAKLIRFIHFRNRHVLAELAGNVMSEGRRRSERGDN